MDLSKNMYSAVHNESMKTTGTVKIDMSTIDGFDDESEQDKKKFKNLRYGSFDQNIVTSTNVSNQDTDRNNE